MKKNKMKWTTTRFPRQARWNSDILKVEYRFHPIAQTVISAAKVVALLAALDMFILSAALFQITTGEGTGVWHPFWAHQARFILGL